MTDPNTELTFLESVVRTYVTSDSPQDRLIKTLAVRTFQPLIRPDRRALEFGCSDGFMTKLIAGHVDQLTVVDGSQTFIEMAKKRVPDKVEFVHSLFEDFSPDHKFDYIFATYVLKHVSDAIGFLKLAGRLLAEDGLLFIVVPTPVPSRASLPVIWNSLTIFLR